MKNLNIDWHKGEQLRSGSQYVATIETDIVEYYDDDLECNIYKMDDAVVVNDEVVISANTVSDEDILQSYRENMTELKKDRKIF